MKITDIRLSLISPPKGKIVAFATVVFDQELAVHDFVVVKRKKNDFCVLMPSRKSSSGFYKEIVKPISTDLFQQIQTIIIRSFLDEVAKPENRFFADHLLE